MHGGGERLARGPRVPCTCRAPCTGVCALTCARPPGPAAPDGCHGNGKETWEKKPSTGPGVARPPCTAPSCLHTRVPPCTKGRCMCVLPHACTRMHRCSPCMHTRAALHLHAHACAPCTHTLAHVCSLLLQALLHVHCLAHPLTCMHTLGVHSLCSHTLARCSLGLHTHTRAPFVHTHRAQTCVFLVHAHICTRMWIRAQGACTRCTDTLRVHMHAPFVHTLAHARPFCAHANTYVLPVHAHACTHVCLP